MFSADCQRLHGHLQRGEDVGAGCAFNGAPQRDVPCHDRRGPHEAHHQIWHDGTLRRLHMNARCFHTFINTQSLWVHLNKYR